MNDCVFVCSGDIDELFSLQKRLIEGVFCIAVDGGFDYCLSIGIQPNLTIGDFDSTNYSLEQISYMSEKVIKLSKDKDFTDLDAAFDYAYKYGYKDFYIYGGLDGKRNDLTLSNLYVSLKYLKKNCKVCFISKDSNTCIYLLKKNEKISLFSNNEEIVSIVSLSNSANISIKNMKYDYEGILHNSSSLGISNRTIVNKKGNIVCNSGYVAIYAPFDVIIKE